MNKTKEIERQIDNQLSESREATIEGVPKDLKDEITWAYVKDGFEVSSSERDDGTYDVTVREDSSSFSSSNRPLSAKEQENIVENEAPVFSQNQVEVYETDKQYHLSADVKKLWQLTSEAMEEKIGSLPVKNPSVESVLLFDGFTIAEAPLLRFPKLPFDMELELTQHVLEMAPEKALNREAKLCIALMCLALGESLLSVTDDYPEYEDVLVKPRKDATTADLDFSDEEIRGLAQLIYNEGLFGELCILIEDGEIEALEDVWSDEGARRRVGEKLERAERHSPTFEVQVNRPEKETRRLYHAFSGEGYTALLMVNPDTFFGNHEVTERRTVASDSPLFVTVMETELKEQHK